MTKAKYWEKQMNLQAKVNIEQFNLFKWISFGGIPLIKMDD